MSCNGCRILRKGCSENCILRPCLQWIESPEAQGHATVFVAKFFGRAGLMSFLSAVPESQRPALFQSLLFEACGRTVNPVNGAVGLVSTGNWHVCQAAVQTVLRGGTLRPIPEFLDEASEPEVTCTDTFKLHQDPNLSSRSKSPRRRRADAASIDQLANFGLSLTPIVSSSQGIGEALNFQSSAKKRRPGTPSMNSEESVTTPCFESRGFGDLCAQIGGGGGGGGGEPKVLNLFN